MIIPKLPLLEIIKRDEGDNLIYAATAQYPLGHAEYMAKIGGLAPTCRDRWNFPWEVNIADKLPEKAVTDMFSKIKAYTSNQFVNKSYLNPKLLIEGGDISKRQCLALRDFGIHDPSRVKDLVRMYPQMLIGQVLARNPQDREVYDIWICIRGLNRN